MATEKDQECFEGEDIALAYTIAEDASAWALAWKASASESGAALVSKASGSGITASYDAAADETTITVTLSSANTLTDLGVGTFWCALARTDSGSKAVLAHGQFVVRPNPAL